MSTQSRRYLTLGWEVNSDMHPSYWLEENARVGGQAERDMVRIPTDSIDTHAILIAQSGAGKSFFLGRLLEEILVNTKSRCLVLDLNGDFRRVAEVDKRVWDAPSYDLKNSRGRLPHESPEVFQTSWDFVRKSIRTLRSDEPNGEKLQIWWPSVSAELIAGDGDPVMRSEIYHCHAFVQAIAKLVLMGNNLRGTTKNVVDAAEDFHERSRNTIGTEYGEEIMSEYGYLFGDSNTDSSQPATNAPEALLANIENTLKNAKLRNDIQAEVAEAARRVGSALRYVSEETARFYFAKARELEAFGILSSSPKLSESDARLQVIDLPSIPDRNTRSVIVSAILSQEWDSARAAWENAMKESPENDVRVPLFIVIDEAHNLIPSNPQTISEKTLREQFRTIAAEGRKYGLFLIMVSQRPDKLDDLILSECGNKAVMKLDSGSIVALVKEKLGLDEISEKTLEKTQGFKQGRVLLAGKWVDRPIIMYTAARRTVEGGRSLRKEFWAS